MKKLGWLMGVVFVLMVVYLGVNQLQVPNNHATTEPAPKVYEPVVYDAKDWTLAQNSRDVAVLMAHLGVPTTDETLDFYGDVATRYRFSAQHEPPLYLVLSHRALELVWYHAHPKDDDDTKKYAQTQAKNIHTVMSAIYGKDATALMQALLKDQKTPSLVGLTHAKCQAYQCQIVLDARALGIQTLKPN